MPDLRSQPEPPAIPETRERLIFAAMDLFIRQGYSSTGVAQILKAADCKSGSLYHFFPTKEDLLVAVLEKYKLMLWPEVMDPVFNRVTDPIERIFGVLDGYRRMLTITHHSCGCPIGNLALELADQLPTVRRLCAENFTGWREAIKGCFVAAIGRFPAGSDPEALASFVLTVMEGAVMQAKTYKDFDAFDQAMNALRDYIERLLAEGTHWPQPSGRTSAKSGVEKRKGRRSPSKPAKRGPAATTGKGA
jgi:TetR/AcrR family transcriptional regulator, transcriptional repressor for nem operon